MLEIKLNGEKMINKYKVSYIEKQKKTTKFVGIAVLAFLSVSAFPSISVNAAQAGTQRGKITSTSPITAKEVKPTNAADAAPITAKEVKPTNAADAKPITAKEVKPTNAADAKPITANRNNRAVNNVNNPRDNFHVTTNEVTNDENKNADGSVSKTWNFNFKGTWDNTDGDLTAGTSFDIALNGTYSPELIRHQPKPSQLTDNLGVTVGEITYDFANKLAHVVFNERIDDLQRGVHAKGNYSATATVTTTTVTTTVTTTTPKGSENSNGDSTTAVGILAIHKTDKVVDGENLAGAIFELRKSDGSVVATLTTDSKGNAISGLVETGTYTLVETHSPEGYVKAPNRQITIKKGQNAIDINAVEAIVDKENHVDIEKHDREHPEKLLSGAQFKIVDLNGNVIENIHGQKMQGLTTDNSGSVVVKGLPVGEYNVIETKAPTGYDLDKTPMHIVVTDTKEQVQVKATDKLTTTILTKIDREHTEHKLAGAEYNIFNEKGEIIKHVVTGTNGEVVIRGLAAGKYTAVETKAPTGYDLDKTPIPFTVTGDGHEVVVTAYDTAITKTNNKSNSTKGTTSGHITTIGNGSTKGTTSGHITTIDNGSTKGTTSGHITTIDNGSIKGISSKDVSNQSAQSEQSVRGVSLQTNITSIIIAMIAMIASSIIFVGTMFKRNK